MNTYSKLGLGLVLLFTGFLNLASGAQLKPRLHSEIKIDLTKTPKFMLESMGFKLDHRNRYIGTYVGVHSFDELKVLDNNRISYQVLPRKVYSEIELDLSVVSPALLHNMGFSLDHPDHGTHIYRRTHSQKEIQILRDSNIPFKMLEEDFAQAYARRWLEIQEKSPRAKRSATVNGHKIPENFRYGDMGGYNTIENFYDEMDRMREVFPNLVSERFSIGKSIEGRDIWTIRISESPDIHQPNWNTIKYDGMTHAREAISGLALYYWIWWILEEYEDGNEEVKSVFSSQNLYYTPVGNPDGVKYNEELEPNGGGNHRKNMRRWDGDDEIGVDLNRNMGKFWGDPGGSSGSRSSGSFRGEEPFSEPEALAYRDWTMGIYPRPPSHALNQHSCANKFPIPWGMGGWTENEDEYIELMDRMTAINDWSYGPTPETLGYKVAGAIKDWNHERVDYEGGPILHEGISVVSEISSGNTGCHWPDEDEIMPLIIEVEQSYLELAIDAVNKFPPSGPMMGDSLGTVSYTRPGTDMGNFNVDIKTVGDMLNVNYNITDAGKSYTFNVIDVNGRVHNKAVLNPGKNSLSISKGDLPGAVYLLNVEACLAGSCSTVHTSKMTLGF